MAVKKEFAFKMMVDTGQGQQEITKVVKNLKEFDDRITDLNKEIRTTDFGSAKFQELNVELQKTRKAQSEVIEESKKQASALTESGTAASSAGTGFLALQKQIKELNVEISKAAESGDEETYEKLTKQLKEVEDQAEMTKIKNQSLSQTLSGIGGPVGGAIQSLKGLNMAFKALVLNPIGAVITAIVLAFTLLGKAFVSTKAGAELLDQVMTGIGAALDVVRDRALKVGEALVKFFTGDFKGAVEAAKGSVSGLGAEIAAEFQEAMAIKKELQAVDNAQRELNKTRALQNKLIAEAKLRINDETLSYADRLKALEEVRTEEIKLAKQEEVLAERRYEAIRAQNALSDSSKEALDAEANAYVVLQQKQLESKTKQKELFDQEKALRDRQRAEVKAAEAERAAAFKEANDKISAYIEEGVQARGITREEELEREKAQFDEALALAVKYKQDTTKLTESYRLQEQAINDKYDKIQLDKELAKQAQLTELTNLEAQNRLSQIELQFGKESEEYRKAEETIRNIQAEGLIRQIEFYQQKATLTTEESLNLAKLQAAYLALQIQQQQSEEQTKKAGEESDKLTKQRLQNQLQAYGELAGTIVSLGKILNKQGEENKALALSEAIINTYLGITQVWGGESVLPEPFATIQKVAATILVAGSGFKSVQGISNTPVRSGGGSGGLSSSSAGVPRPRGLANGGVVGIGTGTSDSVPALLSTGETVINARSSRIFQPYLSAMNSYGGGSRFNNGGVVGLDQIQGLAASSLNNAQNTLSKPIQAYVVSQDMTNQQMFDRAQKTRSTI